MRTLPDEIMDATIGGGPEIISEQHDTSKIDAEARRWDKAEGAGMSVAAANRMAGLDTTGGRVAVMVAGQPAWHKLGVNVAAAVNSADALRLAGLNWTVRKDQLFYNH